MNKSRTYEVRPEIGHMDRFEADFDDWPETEADGSMIVDLDGVARRVWVFGIEHWSENGPVHVRGALLPDGVDMAYIRGVLSRYTD